MCLRKLHGTTSCADSIIITKGKAFTYINKRKNTLHAATFKSWLWVKRVVCHLSRSPVKMLKNQWKWKQTLHRLLKELCEYIDFNFCHIHLKTLTMEKGLKLKKEKKGQHSQVWTQYNPKIPKSLIWIAFPRKNHLIVSFRMLNRLNQVQIFVFNQLWPTRSKTTVVRTDQFATTFVILLKISCRTLFAQSHGI